MFRAYIEDCVRPYIDHFTVCYLDDILIYLTNEKEDEDQVRKVLQCLPELELYCKAEKCQFQVREVVFLGYVIILYRISMESDRISTIEDWPTMESVRDVQVLLGFANFYTLFIRKYAKVTSPISNMLKTHGLQRWEWARDAELAFRRLKMAFTEAPILKHFNPQKAIILQTDASRFAIANILIQYDGFGFLHAVNFNSWKCSASEQNYHTYSQRRFAIVETMKQWRRYLEGANHYVLIQCDH